MVNDFQFGGVSYGGMCEVPDGRGYAVVVDQVGFINPSWQGSDMIFVNKFTQPQFLAQKIYAKKA